MINRKKSKAGNSSVALDEYVRLALHTDKVTLRPPSRKKIDRVLSGNSSPKEKILLYFDSLAYTNITTDREEYLTEEEAEYVCNVYLNSKKTVFTKEIALFFKGFTIFKDSIKNTEHRVELVSTFISVKLREAMLMSYALDDINQIVYSYISEDQRIEALNSINPRRSKVTKRNNESEVWLDIDSSRIKREIEDAIKQLVEKVEEFKLFKELFENITAKRLPLPSVIQYIKSCSNRVEETYSDIVKGVNLFNQIFLDLEKSPIVIPSYESIKSEEITPEDIESIKEIGR